MLWTSALLLLTTGREGEGGAGGEGGEGEEVGAVVVAAGPCLDCPFGR